MSTSEVRQRDTTRNSKVRDDPGEVLTRRVEWQPAGMPTPFLLALDDLFAEAYE